MGGHVAVEPRGPSCLSGDGILGDPSHVLGRDGVCDGRNRLLDSGAMDQRLAITIPLVNMASDMGNAIVRGDLRTLIGIPIAAAIIWYSLDA
jgi:hypothetical protein